MPFSTGHALLIGISGYAYAPRLGMPIFAADVSAVSAVLRDSRVCGYPPEQVTLLVDAAATRDGILAALDTLAARAGEGDTVFIYYAGHGGFGENGYYLMAHDSQVAAGQLLGGTALGEADLIAKFAAIKAKRLLFIVNACHTGDFSSALAPDGEPLRGAPLPPHVSAALLGTGEGRVLISACRENQCAFIGPGPLPLFTEALIDGLRGSGVSSNGGYISASDLYMHLYSALSEAVPRKVAPAARQRCGERQEPELTILTGTKPFAVACYRGAISGNGFDDSGQLFAGPAVREVHPDDARAMARRYLLGRGGDLEGGVIGEAGSAITQSGDIAQRFGIVFGRDNQFGDVSIGDVAGGNIDKRSGVFISNVIASAQIYESSNLEIEPGEPAAVPDPVGIVGREAEQAYFADALIRGHLAVITGAPGVGKTALAVSVARQFATSKRIFWHSFQPHEETADLVRKLAEFVAWHRREADAAWKLSNYALQHPEQRIPLRDLIDRLIPGLRGQNFLLCFDDFQFIDEDGDRDLNYLIQRLLAEVSARTVSLLVTAWRVPPAFANTRHFERVEGLDATNVRQFLAMHQLDISEELCDRLTVLTAGNAQLLTLIANSLDDTSEIAELMADLETTDGLEQSAIENMLSQRVDRILVDEQRDVLRALAVLDGTGTRDEIEVALDADRSIQSALRGLLNRNLLMKSQQAGGTYTMHRMLQRFYYGELGRHERRTMHRRVGAYLEEEEEDLFNAARHFERAGEYDRAVRLATSDVRALINQGHARSLRTLLARFERRRLDDEQWIVVNTARAEVHGFLGESHEAQRCYLAAMELLEQQPTSAKVRDMMAELCRGMASILEHSAPQEARSWLQRGLALVANVNLLEEGKLLHRLGSLYVNSGEYDEALAPLERALACLSEETGLWRARVLMSLGIVHCSRGDLIQGRDFFRQAQRVYQRMNDYWGLAALAQNLGRVLDVTGDWPGSAAEYRQGLAWAEQIGNVLRQSQLLLNLGILETNRGNHAVALEMLSKSLDIARRYALRSVIALVQSSIADYHIRRGEWAVAEAALDDAEPLAQELGTRDQFPEIYRSRAMICLARGEVQAAEAFAQQAITTARELEDQPAEGMGLRVLGQVLLASGKQAEAHQEFAASLALLEGQEPYEAARTQMALGKAFLAAGDLEAASRLLEEARAVFTRLGAQYDLWLLDR